MIKLRMLIWMCHGHAWGRWEMHKNVGMPEGKCSVRKCEHRWEDIIKMDVTEIGLEGVDLIYLSQYRRVRGLL
jgi:hypothetical protein